MADRSIAVHIKAVVTDFQRAMGQAEGSLKGFNQTAKRTAEDYSSAMTTVGIAAAGAGLAIAGGLAAGVKAAVDWESSFAGVVKTVDATTEELAVLERGLRDLALEIPVSQAELAGIAEAAGQLGIETGNILEFTETMAALGVATNLTSEEAATMFARFANITQLPQDQIENLGSAVVDLGNNLATTEAEIIEMGLRIAGAGAQIGLTEAEILGFAGALSSVGIEAQAGGSAISRVFIEVDKAVRAGGDSLAGFAETAGMSAEEFRQAYEEDAAGAIVTFIEGLGRISASGGDVFSILEDLELQDLRVRDALLRAAGAGDLFRESIDRSSTAFETNTALTEEAARRYETVASQFEIFKNTLVELGIGIGEVLLPVLTPLR
jgi:TP901 family phage tail tape measure protein